MLSILNFFRGLINFLLGIFFILNTLLFGVLIFVPRYVPKNVLLSHLSSSIKESIVGNITIAAYDNLLIMPMILLFLLSIVIIGIISWKVRKTLYFHGIIFLIVGTLYIKIDSLNAFISGILPGKIAYGIEEAQDKFNQNFMITGIIYVVVAVILIGIAIYLTSKDEDRKEELKRREKEREYQANYKKILKEQEAQAAAMNVVSTTKVSSTESLYQESIEEFNIEEKLPSSVEETTPMQAETFALNDVNLFNEQPNEKIQIPIVEESITEIKTQEVFVEEKPVKIPIINDEKPAIENVVSTTEPTIEKPIISSIHCHNCGSKNDIDYVFCESCGTKRD